MGRVYIAIAAVLALAGGVWYVRHLQTSRDAYEARASSAESQLAAERQARAHEKEIADAAVKQYETTVTDLQADLAKRPLKPVVIRVPVPSVSSANSPTTTTSGANESSQERESGTTEVDIASELTNYALDCQINTLQLEALQDWVKAR